MSVQEPHAARHARGKKLAKGSYRVTATVGRHGQDRHVQREVNAGVLAFGDSITNGGGELQWGVALQSWALWTARGLGLPFTGYAVDGARADHVANEQVPAFEQRTALAGARYDVGCLYAGVNDVRAPDWDAAAFARDYARCVEVPGRAL